MATWTGVGYGDAVPAPGRIVAGMTALFGIGVIAVPTGLMAGAFPDAFRVAREVRGRPRRDGP